MVCDRMFAGQWRILGAVLILILLEYGLRPAFLVVLNVDKERLNPYSIGIWSATRNPLVQRAPKRVLILILLEYGLRRNQNDDFKRF